MNVGLPPETPFPEREKMLTVVASQAVEESGVHCTIPQWAFREPVHFEDIFLVELRQVSGKNWQPVFSWWPFPDEDEQTGPDDAEH